MTIEQLQAIDELAKIKASNTEKIGKVHALFNIIMIYKLALESFIELYPSEFYGPEINEFSRAFIEIFMAKKIECDELQAFLDENINLLNTKIEEINEDYTLLLTSNHDELMALADKFYKEIKGLDTVCDGITSKAQKLLKSYPKLNDKIAF